MTTEIVTIFILLLLNGFFALSEIAIVSASKPLLRQLAKEGNKKAQVALDLGENSGKFLSTVQVGITLVGILAGAYGGATLAEKLTPILNEFAFIAPHGESVSVFLIVALITYFSVVIGELVPKQFALSRPEKLALFVARPMAILSKSCSPIVYILEKSGEILLKIMGVSGSSEGQVTEAEVKAILGEGVESGVIEKSEHEVLQRVIRLGDRDVKSIMTHRRDVAFIDINDSLDEIRAKIKAAGHSRYPVTDGNPDKVVGIIQAKDLLDTTLFSQDFKIRDHVKEVRILTDNSSCLKAMDVFKKSNLHIVVVVDEYGGTEGIVSTSDILEAIIGILPSNYDDGQTALIVQRKDGSWLVDGRTPIDEIHLMIGLEEIKGDNNFETIAGFLLYRLAHQPQEGEIYEEYGYRFEVADMDERRVDKIIISRISSAAK